jgi:hypothetical protein
MYFGVGFSFVLKNLFKYILVVLINTDICQIIFLIF